MNKLSIKVALVAATFAFGASAATATTVDFTTLAAGTAVTTQFAGVTFSLLGGPSSSGSPIATTIFGYNPVALSNSNSGYYPTSDSVVATFSSAVSGVSFTFENFGVNSSSNYTAYDASNNIVSSGFLGNDTAPAFGGAAGFGLPFIVNVAGSGITKLQISNGFGTRRSWEFGIGQVSFVAGVPEASSWVMMIAGFGLVGAAMRRKALVAA